MPAPPIPSSSTMMPISLSRAARWEDESVLGCSLFAAMREVFYAYRH
jgi:hypothetical protein